MDENTLRLGFALASSYLLGAIPFGWLLVKLAKGVDIRTLGSGNIGATNAGRALGRWAALLVYLLDFGKGLLPTKFFALWFSLTQNDLWVPVILGTAAILGHCFPIYLRFKGGKGVATTTGVMIALDSLSFFLAGGIWVVSFALFRYVSLASILLAVSIPGFVFFQDMGSAFTERLPLMLFSALMAVFILWTHRQNLQRLWAGTEPRAGEKKSQSLPENPGP